MTVAREWVDGGQSVTTKPVNKTVVDARDGVMAFFLGLNIISQLFVGNILKGVTIEIGTICKKFKAF